MKPIKVLAADPAWCFRDALPGRGRGAVKHYPTLQPYEIMRFPLPPLADDALLFLWRVAAMPALALDVVSAWGFTPKSELVWVKITSARLKRDLLVPRGSTSLLATSLVPLAIGMGHYTRASHETCIIATRGRPKVRDRGVRSVFFAPRGAHSAKPDAFYTIVERLAAGPYAELFARTRREGWTQYGNQLPGGRAAPTIGIGVM